MLHIEERSFKNFDVFVTELCEGNLNKEKKSFTLTQSIDICKQLLEGLVQLWISGNCHNDLKPENILYKVSDERCEDGDRKIIIKIGDFGTAGRSGGTPGWTWPKFLSKRMHGRSDMYSIGLLVLYVMCDSRDLFYRLRDNYIDPEQEWLIKFREEPLVSFVIKLMRLELNVFDASRKWNEISNGVDFLSRGLIQEDYKIPVWSSCFYIQDNMDKNTVNFADATLLDK